MSFPIIDGHLDLAYNACTLGRDVRRPVAEIRRQDMQDPPPGNPGTCLVSIPALREGKIAVIGSSIFVAPARKRDPQDAATYHNAEEAHALGVEQLDFYRRLADEDDRVTLIKTRADLEQVFTSLETEHPQVGLFIVMEGADPIRTPGELRWWIERGLRGVGLTWAAGTRYAGGNSVPGPLTDAGTELLQAMADVNLLLDLSHLWEEAAYAALDQYPGPIVATHANPRAFLDSPRHLSDTLIQRLAARGGLMGILPCNRMLDGTWSRGDPRLPLTKVVEAIDYVCQLVGSAKHVGIGSDLDGGFGRESVPAGIETIADLKKIAPLLADRGYADDDIERIFYRNWSQILQQALAAF